MIKTRIPLLLVPLLVLLGATTLRAQEEPIVRCKSYQKSQKPLSYKIGLKFRSREGLGLPSTAVVQVCIKPDHVNGDDLVRLASQFKSDFCREAVLMVSVFTDRRYIDVIAVPGLPLYEAAAETNRGFYYLNRNTREEYISFSSVPNYDKNAESRTRIELGRTESPQATETRKSAEVLTNAAMRGETDIVRDHLNKGIQVNAAAGQGWTALMAASTFGRADIVKLLLAAGADANVKLPNGATRLYQAAANGNKEIVEALIAAAAELDAKTSDGETPLMRAASMGRTAIVKVLIAAGADVSPRNKNGWSAFRFASTCSDSEAIRAFLDTGADANGADETGKTPLMWATRNQHNDALQALLDAGADVSVKSSSGSTVLMYAGMYLDISKVTALLKAGADVNARDGKSWTALMYVAFNVRGNPECGTNDWFMRVVMAGSTVKKLIDAGAEINAKSQDGETALMLAAGSGNAEIVGSLLAAGADPNAKTLKGRTALRYAAELPKEKRKEIRRLLENAKVH